jgi:hypothetical protein
VQRSFPTLHERTEANSLLRKLVLFDFSETRWSEQAQLPLHVGVHMIKISVPQDSELGLSSPDVLHQDGEPYTFAHLIYRRNAVGGVNSIAMPAAAGTRAEQLASDTLLARFEYRCGPRETWDEAVNARALGFCRVKDFVTRQRSGSVALRFK